MFQTLSSVRRVIGFAVVVAVFTGADASPEPERAEVEINALERWRPRFERIESQDIGFLGQLTELSSAIRHDTLDTDVAERLRELSPLVDSFALLPGETLRFPVMHGPETPFPDHAPLAQVARLRGVSIKLAWLDGDSGRALSLARENLVFARLALTSQEGIIPVINATNLWQSALDGVYWLARQPTLSREDAARLQDWLAGDGDLAARAVARAFQGEFSFVQKVVVERLPQTRDPELILEAIGTLGMAPPAGPGPDEPRLPITERFPLDPVATLAGADAEARLYVSALSDRPGRHPHELLHGHIVPRRSRAADELGAFLRYAVADEPATEERIAAAAEVLAQVDNAAGKLYLLIALPHWNAISETVFRRQAQSNALQGLLAWRRLGRPADWAELVEAGLLGAPPPDPFGEGALRMDATEGSARIWSVGPDREDNGGAGDGENLGRPDDLAWPAAVAAEPPPPQLKGEV